MTDRAGPAIAETHISTVLFVGDRAYKLLKPVETGFLDHRTTESRLAAIDQELSLNRRLAPTVYLGSADVVEGGTVVDRMLVMRRLSPDRRLASLAGTAELGSCVGAVARAIAAFHAGQQPVVGDEGRDIAGRDAVRANWLDNFHGFEPLVGRAIGADEAERVQALVAGYLDGREQLFEARIAGGFVRDGHGDLTAEDIFCEAAGPQILDCLAFDRRLRIADVLADVAFLAMDLDRLAGPPAAADFVAAYRQFSDEHHPSSLAHHYVAYRASVRAKVAAIRHGQGAEDEAGEAARYHRLSLDHLEAAEPVLVLVGGPPGSGKSTLARSLSRSTGAMVLSSDELRKDLAGVGHLDRRFSPPGGGIYSATMTDRTYDELADRASRLLARGESVILDASWSQRSHRERAHRVAEAGRATLVELRCDVDPAVARARTGERLAGGDDPSDARPEILDALRDRSQPWPSATVVDTGPSPERATRSVIEGSPSLLARSGPGRQL